MDQIERVIQEKKEQYRIVFQHHAPIIVSESLLVRHRLLKGQTFTDEEMASLAHDVKSDMAVQQAVHYIDVKMRTTKEVAQYLKEKDYPADIIDDVLYRLIDWRLLDDTLYAESYMRTKMREGKYGPRYIKQQLIQKGVATSIAEASQAEYTDEALYRNTEHQVEKLWHRYRQKSYREQAQKVYQTLVQKGFPSDAIKECLQAYEEEKDEEAEYERLVAQASRYVRKSRQKEPWERKQYVKRSLYQKGFPMALIERFIEEEEL